MGLTGYIRITMKKLILACLMVMGCNANLSYRIGPCTICNSYYRVHVESPNADTNKKTAMEKASEYCGVMGKGFLIISQRESNSITDVSYQMDFDCVPKVSQ